MPYLTKVKDAMKGGLTFDVRYDTDNQPAAVDLKVDGRSATIGLYGSTFQCHIRDRSINGSPAFHSIRSAADVSDENLGLFIKAVLDSQ